MSSKTNQLEKINLYFASTQPNPLAYPVLNDDNNISESKILSEVIESYNELLMKRDDKNHKIYPLIDREYHFLSINQMDWVLENNFRQKKIHCFFIDHECILSSPAEFFTIRAHFFPKNEGKGPFFVILLPHDCDSETDEYYRNFSQKWLKKTGYNVLVKKSIENEIYAVLFNLTEMTNENFHLNYI